MEAAAILRGALLRSIISSLGQPLDPSRTAAIAQQLVESALLTGGPDGTQSGLWAPVTELQGKLVEQLLKHLTKGEAAFRPGAAILLGLLCRNIPARAFLASYAEWAAALLELVRREPSSVSKSAGLRALGDLFTRVRELLEVPGVRRDSSSIAGRTLQVATPLITDADCQVSALAAVHAVLQALPSVARNHTGPLERGLVGLIAAPASRHAVRCSAAAALALVPRAAADDAAAWSTLIRRVLLSLHTAIDLLLYHGGGISAGTGGGGSGGGGSAPDGGLGDRAREQLEAVGQGVADAEGLLGQSGFVSGSGGGGGGGAAAATAVAARPDVTLTMQVTVALLQCLVTLVGRGANSPVPLPSQALLLLVMRMLKVDAAVLLAPGRVAQSAVLALLPDLHVSAWEILGLTARVARTTLMPLMALACRVLGEHMRRIKAGGAGGLAVTMPASVRTSLYRTTVAVLRVGGFAAGRYLATDTLGMLVTELYGLSATQQQEQSRASLSGRSAGLGKAPSAMGVSPPLAKKAKTTGDPLSAFDAATAAAAASVVAPVSLPSDVEAQVVALGVAEALLQVYGPAMSVDQRGQLDALSYHMAAVLEEAAYRIAKEPGAATAARAADVAVLRVAATRSLAASLVAPWPSRHPFLSDGLQLLSSGASGAGGVTLAEACTNGLLALEALLRPRSVPMTAMRTGGGICGGSVSGSATDTNHGLFFPRPRLWSMLDPMQPQLPAASAALTGPTAQAHLGAGATPAVNGRPVEEGRDDAPPKPVSATKVVAVVANGVQEMEAEPSNSRAAGGIHENPHELIGEPRTAPAHPPATSGKKGKGEKNKAKGTGKAPAPATMGPAPAQLPGRKGDKRRKEGNVKEAAVDTMKVDDPGAQSTGAKAASSPAPTQLPPPRAVTAAAPPAQPVPAAVAAVFGEESEDSEGSLPDIDSGGDSEDD